jgi:hypothetical protein
VKQNFQTEEPSCKEEEEDKEEEESKCQDTKTPYRFFQKNHSKNLILGNKYTEFILEED